MQHDATSWGETAVAAIVKAATEQNDARYVVLGRLSLRDDGAEYQLLASQPSELGSRFKASAAVIRGRHHKFLSR